MENNKTLNEKLSLVKDAVLKYIPAKYIYLFGSHVDGNASDDSDIDVYVVYPDYVDDDIFFYANITGELCEKKIYDIDLHYSNESHFNKYKNLSRFQKTIFEKGILLYDNV